MKFKGLKVGDEICVVEQKKRWSSDQKMSVQKVTKIGRQYGYFHDGYFESKFCLETGHSSHPRDSNSRANGYGFDVFASEAEYNQHIKDTTEYARLTQRLMGHWGSRLVSLPPETVQKIHAILDEMPKAES